MKKLQAADEWPKGKMTKADFENLADFRYQLRRFLRFSERVTRAGHHLTAIPPHAADQGFLRAGMGDRRRARGAPAGETSWGSVTRVAVRGSGMGVPQREQQRQNVGWR